MSKSKTSIMIIPVLAATSLAQTEELKIGINFYNTIVPGFQKSTETVIGGENFPETEEGESSRYWNNVRTGGSDLMWNNGSLSSIGLSTSNGFPLTVEFGNNPYRNTQFRAGLATSGRAESSVTLSNLQTNFPSGCRIVVYLGGQPAVTGAAISDGSRTNYFQTPNPKNPALLEITDTDPGDGYDVGTYVIFGSAESPLTEDSVTLSLFDVLNSRAIFGAIQLIGQAVSSGVYPEGPKGLLIGWDTGNSVDYRTPGVNGSLFGGSWPDNTFNGSIDGSFGTIPGSSTNFWCSFAVTTNLNTLTIGVRNSRPGLIRLDTIHFDFAPKKPAVMADFPGSPDGVELQFREITELGVTNWIPMESVSNLAERDTRAGNSNEGLYNFDWPLTNMPNQTLSRENAVNLRLAAKGGTGEGVSIFDNIGIFGTLFTHYETWSNNFFASFGEGEQAVGKEDDPDGDGIDNLTEYAFGGNPTNGNSIGWQPALGDAIKTNGLDYIEYIYFRRITEGSDLHYTLERSTDLIFDDWSTSMEHLEISTGVAVTNHIQSVTNWILTAGKSIEFLQVKAER